MSLFCIHKWELLSETVTESKYEVAIKHLAPGTTKVELPWQLADARRTHIQTFTCEKCGKLRRFTERI